MGWAVYPNGLRGKEISLEDRIISIVDAFAAMTREKSYGIVISKDQVLETLLM
jgi:HD-GYP domain-containing protein (c-di-GMP phosphodiesterase class II)